jgi:hypothetical protein
MIRYRLPADALRRTHGVTGLNMQVRRGDVQLDWTDVVEAADETLRLLVAGCDLGRDAEALGIDTIAEPLASRVADILTGAGPLPSASAASAGSRESGRGEVAVFTAPREASEDALELMPGPALEPHAQPLHRAAAPMPRQMRDEIISLVERDLVGPAGGENEIITETSVRERYLCGALPPRETTLAGDEDDDIDPTGADDEELPADSPARARDAFIPNAVGLTACIDGGVDTVPVRARWGVYDRVSREADDGGGMVWRRRQIDETHALRLTEGVVTPWHPVEGVDVVITGRARRHSSGWMVTLFLANQQARPRQLVDGRWIFQVSLTVGDPEARGILVARPATVTAGDEEDAHLRMLYRQHREVAVGHGTAVHVEWAPDGRGRAVTTTPLPRAAVPTATPPKSSDLSGLDHVVLDMQTLAHLDGTALVEALMPLAAGYATWIASEAARVDDPAEGLEEHRDAALRALEQCREARRRILAGIELVAHDAQASTTFRLMNEAMWQQRVHSEVARSRREGVPKSPEQCDVPEKRTWYPFQLAFILMALPSLSDPRHPERAADDSAIADLLWFPTGGGKTEAYLGLAAYTLAIRRMQGMVEGRDGGVGLAVLMRYTLRLLTIQQFQRAATLVCALESLRRRGVAGGDTALGVEPFRIGLWVGERTTPNRTDMSDEAVSKSRSRGMSGIANPLQLTACPWCGEPLELARDVVVETMAGGRGRTLVYCSDRLGRCEFSRRISPREGIPVVTVDEEIYRLLPGLIVATVDKFAQMPWNPATAALFGRVDRRCERHGFRHEDDDDLDSHLRRGDLPSARTTPCPPPRPPDLIIQDELHLISSALGTLVGAYETAVDELCTWTVDGSRVRPKLIASTATIRRSYQQVRALFARDVRVFPPQALDADDSYFARQRPADDGNPGRIYVGVCAPGQRLKKVLIRVNAAWLAAAQTLFARYGPVADPWMTLVGYFNTLRELGGTVRLLQDDVPSLLRRIDTRGLETRRLRRVRELTSRLSSSDIPTVLDQLAVPFRDGRQVPAPLDVLLATSMVSVGVDVPRLGLMVVAGQPKSTAEYIQATSRVGRSHAAPGVVCSVLQWTRPRDLSHLERFEHFHATFYREVEALSVTPFAPRAVDRALTGVLVSLVRLRDAHLRPNSGAQEIRLDDPAVLEAVEAITRRSAGFGEEGRVREALLDRVRAWHRETGFSSGRRRLGYRDERDGVTIGLLEKPGADAWSMFTCATSLREVEPSVALILDTTAESTVGPAVSPSNEAAP